MKKLSIILIIVGLLIAAYPLLDELYTMYLQTKLVTEWDVDLYETGLSTEASEDYAQLQYIFEEALEEPEDDDIDFVEDSTSPESGTSMPSDQAVEEPLPTESNEPEDSPTPTAKPKNSQQYKAIGRIKIDKISLNIPILHGTSKANLKLGAGQITGTSKLGDVGNAALAAHRSHTYGRMFNRLDELEIGDKIIVETADGTFEYTVYEKLVVEPDDVSVLNRNDKDRVLTLVTCTPLYTATHRLIVHAVIRD